MALTYEKALDRVKKLLALAKGAGSDAEAAAAAAQAADIMREFELSEAELRLVSGEDDRSREQIIEERLDERNLRRRVAWESAIVSAVAKSYGCRMYWHGAITFLFGRESAVQATRYTSEYLRREVDRLADEAWEESDEYRGDNVHRFGNAASARKWKYNFRLGAAGAISQRLFEQVYARRRDASRMAHEAAAARQTRSRSAKASAEPNEIKADALALVERDPTEVDSAWEGRSAKFGTASSMGRTTHRGGYAAGRSAGASVHLGGGRAGLGAGQGRLR